MSGAIREPNLGIEEYRRRQMVDGCQRFAVAQVLSAMQELVLNAESLPKGIHDKAKIAGFLNLEGASLRFQFGDYVTNIVVTDDALTVERLEGQAECGEDRIGGVGRDHRRLTFQVDVESVA